MSSIHESTKALVHHAFDLYAEALDNGRPERAAEIRKTLEEVFDNTVDDNAKLLEAKGATTC